MRLLVVVRLKQSFSLTSPGSVAAGILLHNVRTEGKKKKGEKPKGISVIMAQSLLATSKFSTLTILQQQSFVSFPPPRPPSSTSAPTFHVYLIINPSILISLISLESLLTSQGFCVFFFCFRKSRVSSGWRLRPKVSY